jgi:hypothetical protein
MDGKYQIKNTVCRAAAERLFPNRCATAAPTAIANTAIAFTNFPASILQLLWFLVCL